MNPVWPPGLPQFVNVSGYDERLPDQTIESEVDAGRAKIRRRFAAGVRPQQFEIDVTSSQVDTFETFYNTTLAAGTLPFDWVHPRTQSAVTFRFRKPSPRLIPLKGPNWRISMTLEILP